MHKLDPQWPEEDFGPYRLSERLGVGGMASVYRAVHRETGQRVALKRLLPQLAGDAMLIRQFRREADIARSLAHPNMAYVHDFGEVDGVHYLTMEEIDGRSVLELLRRANELDQPAPIGVSLWIIREILCALDYAMTGLDANGEPFNIVHRDLSPSNVIINLRGEVKIIDFGVAKSLHGRYATNSGRIKGKLGYMAPEALAGRAIDSRSDLYSLAVLSWELLTAQRLFRGTEREQLGLRAQQHQRIPPSAHNPDVPRELDHILAVALAEDPAQRWSSAAEMLEILEPLLQAEGQSASPRALRAWVDEVTGADDSAFTSQIRAADDNAKASTDRGEIFVPAVTIPTSPRNIPGVRRFKDDVRTTVDPIFDPRERHRAITGADEEVSVSLAAGSCEFAAPTEKFFIDLEDPITAVDGARDPDTLEINDIVASYVLHDEVF